MSTSHWEIYVHQVEGGTWIAGIAYGPNGPYSATLGWEGETAEDVLYSVARYLDQEMLDD